MSYVLGTYARSVKENFVSGKGIYLYTDKGEEFIDLVQGISVNAFGHNHEYLVKTIKEQSEKPWHVSNLFLIKEQERFAERLCKFTGFDAVGFQNSGAEATELAIKAAVKYFYSKGKKEKNRILCVNNSFHGRTIATISAGNNPKHIEGFPILKNFDHFEFGNSNELKEKINDKTCAILIETIVGEGGIKVVPEHILNELRDICNKRDILLICDEIQSGYYRSGKFFAYQHTKIKPDLVLFAKSVAGGFPAAGCLFTKKVAESMSVGSHGSTFAGSPLSMSLANAVLDLMLKDDFENHILEISKYFLEKLNYLKKKFSPIIKEIRGKGLMLGIQLNQDPKKLIKTLLDNKLIVIKANENVIRLFPPLIVSKEEIDKAIKIFDQSLQKLT